MKKISTILAALLISPAATADWFDDVRENGTPEDLYRVLWYMPKGGDLHNHLSGAVFSEWWYELALAQRERGYEYYTKVRIDNCRDYGGDEFGGAPYYLMFRNITALDYARLDDCEKGEYKRLEDLDEREKAAWMDGLRLDKPHEGRDEFFQTHWQRLNALYLNPHLQAETAAINLKAYAEESVAYVEYQIAGGPYVGPDGNIVSPNDAFEILRQRLAQKDVRDTGVTVRFQLAILRFLPNAEEHLRGVYQLVHDNPDLFVGVNMVGREDNDKGYPARFLPTLRELRHEYGGVRLSIHAGEVDEPNFHVRDTLLLGADRIGHGINLITDDDTMLLMRHGPYLVEINLISNLLLQYISDYSQHPFPEYLRTGIPVALSTDDRGMWESTMTDEFFVAVTEFNLSWDEIRALGRNSLAHSFAPEDVRKSLLDAYESRIERYGRDLSRRGIEMLGPMPDTRRFICGRYDLCR
ncbi:MAG: adenosine deaminase [Gammaproteobacteria bacterium]|nr:adenosine deaminase [Gammaproteobacteria bacterium]MDH5344538.1 adenosine deaminase [Gammaproteobacteria bacterium]